jgi:hypothetical protein
VSLADASVNSKDGQVTADTGAPDTGADASVPPPMCNDGHIDPGETCDPLADCPTACPPIQCQLRSLDNGGTCAASCTNVAVQTACLNGDGCCPDSCNTTDDTDCNAVCGNGIVEGKETCDGTCPTTCKPVACMNRKISGSAATCDATCVDDTPITACNAVSDGCCPNGCTAPGDPDCAAGACGNGTVDGTEKCDVGIAPPGAGSCPDKCAATGCNLFKLDQPGTCNAQCLANGSITQCANGDGCCAPGCNSTNDNDCVAKCGNGVVEPPTETCDGNCPTQCPQRACQLYKLVNGGTCTAQCVADTLQNNCVNGDGCCPSNCDSTNDNDCTNQPPSKCGNGIIDPGETCDGNCVPCPPSSTCITSTGSAATCDLRCNVPITQCDLKTADACCPLVPIGGAAATFDCAQKTDLDCKGTGWLQVTKGLVTIPKGECDAYTIDGITSGASYDITTCGKTVTAAGDVDITSVVQAPIATPMSSGPPPISYGSNKDCTTKTALPLLANWTCANKDGVVTMACVSDAPGGFVAKNANAITVTFCAITDTTFPITVWYNAPTLPTITFAGIVQ